MSLRFFTTVIQKTKKPFCVDCIHYIDYKYENPYDEIYDNYKLGKCSKFGEKNLVTGKMEYDDALSCRKMYLKCGESGYYFEKTTLKKVDKVDLK